METVSSTKTLIRPTLRYEKIPTSRLHQQSVTLFFDGNLFYLEATKNRWASFRICRAKNWKVNGGRWVSELEGVVKQNLLIHQLYTILMIYMKVGRLIGMDIVGIAETRLQTLAINESTTPQFPLGNAFGNTSTPHLGNHAWKQTDTCCHDPTMPDRLYPSGPRCRWT